MTIFDRDKIQEIAHAIRQNRGRSVMTALGVFWGMFMLIIMLGAGSGLKNGTTSMFGQMATNSVYIWTQNTTMPYKGYPRGRRFNFTNDDIQALKDGVPELDIVAPRNQLGGHRGSNQVIRGNKNGAFEVNGDYPEFWKIQPKEMIKGRFLNDLDIEEKRKICVIGKRVQELLFKPDENPIGEYIQISGVYYQVVGVFDVNHSGWSKDRELQTIFVPFTTFQKAFNYGNLVSWFSVTIKDDVPAEIVEDKVIKFLAKRHDVHPMDKHAFGHWNAGREFKRMTSLFKVVNIITWIVGIGTLLAGVIGISNIMLVIVKERTKEIGIKRALGARPREIVTQIIVESTILTIIAGYLGLLASVGLVEGVSSLLETTGSSGRFFKNPEIDFRMAVQALIILIFAGIMAGLIPASKAVSVKPIDALRYEN